MKGALHLVHHKVICSTKNDGAGGTVAASLKEHVIIYDLSIPAN